MIALWGFLGFAAAAGVALPFPLCAGADFGRAVEQQLGWMILGVGLYFLLVLGLYAAGLFNGLIRLRERVKRAWAMVEVELQRRADLIPNLADTVNAYAAHEQGVQRMVAQLRQAPPRCAGNTPSQAQVQAVMDVARLQTSAANRLLAIAENYPALKASALYQKLAASLADTENRLALGRSFFNASVELHNARLLRFPDSLFTRLGGFAPVAYYAADEAQKAAAKVAF